MVDQNELYIGYSENEYYNPDLSFERKTRALNPYLGAAVSLVSLFTVGIFVYVLHLIIVFVADIKSTI